MKVVFAFEREGEQIGEGYLREESLTSEADQAAAAAAIEAGRYVACGAYNVSLPLVSFARPTAEADGDGDAAQDGGQGPAMGEAAVQEEINREGAISKNSVNLRTGPSKSYDIASVRDQGDVVFVLRSLTGEDGALWYCIEYEARTLYVMAEFVTLTPVETPGPSVPAQEDSQVEAEADEPLTDESLSGGDAPVDMLPLLLTGTAEAKATLVDGDTQVVIDGVPADVTASVAVVAADEEALEAALNEAGLTLRDAVCYDITLWQNDSEYQPSDKLSVTLPIPAAFTGEISAWHISGGTATNMGGSAADGAFTFETAHFSQYALVSAAPYGGTSDDGGAKAESTFLEKAEAYYGENGSLEVGSVAVNWLDADGTVKAGQQVNLNLEWKLNPAATFTYTDSPQPLFDDYRNTQIILTLPDGVSIVEGAAGSLQNVTEVTREGNTWRLMLTESLDAASSQSGTITIPLLIEGNGERGVGETLDFSTPVRMETEFTIMDRTDPGQVQPSREYDKAIDGNALSSKTTATDDRWGIVKTAVSAVPNDEKTAVTVTFRLMVGLEDANGEINTNPDTYGRVGRVPFADEVTLTETPSVQDRDGKAIEAQSVTITPQFGQETPIGATVGGEIILPVDTCADKGISSAVAGNAPYLSTYLVEVVYPYEKFVAQFYDEKQDKLTVSNTARLDYQLKGVSPGSDEAQASIEAGEVTQPAQITISKYIVNAQGEATLYSAANFPAGSQPITGAAAFTITGPDGTAPDLYDRQVDTYQKLDGAKITLDPAGTDEMNGTNGTFTVYVQPGDYTVSEKDMPANTEKIVGGTNNAEDKKLTLEAGGRGTAGFYNRECLGSITITKLGQRAGWDAALLPGVAFALYRGNQKVAEGTTDDNGHLLFPRLPYGEYTVKETEVPQGYVDEKYEETVTVSAEKSTYSLEAVNKYNSAPVILQKQMFNGVDYVNVDQYSYEEFANCFAIERKTGDGSWVTVEGKDKQSLTQAGQILAVLPVYDDAGDPITYRFKETLPTGWHDPKNASAEVMYSEEFDLVYYLGKPTGEAKEIVMQNDRNGSLALTKQFYRMSGSGQYELQQDEEATFTLYQKTKNGKPVPVKSETFTGSTAFVDLPRTDEQGQPYEYYLVEKQVAGYAADTSETVPLQIGGQNVSAWGPYTFVAEDDKPAVLSQSAVVSNYSTALPVVIKKADSITGAFVSGAAFEIDEYDGGIDGQKVVEETSITSSAGSVVYLEGGKRYVVKESTVPEGYTNVTEAKDVIIDLSAYTSPEKAKDYKVITITLKNRPDPRLNVVKHLTGSENPDKPTVLTGVTFEVYSKTGEETFEQVNGYDGQLLTLSSGTAKQLPAGTYYLKEIVLQDNPNQILDPNRHSGEYTGKGEQADDAFYFGPVEVPEVTSEATLTTTYTVENLSSLGAVRVTKYALGEDGQKTPLAGATLAIYQEGKTEALQKKISASETGLVTFTNLPIYDDNGEKIKYIAQRGCDHLYHHPDQRCVRQRADGQSVPGRSAAAGHAAGRRQWKCAADGRPGGLHD